LRSQAKALIAGDLKKQKRKAMALGKAKKKNVCGETTAGIRGKQSCGKREQLLALLTNSLQLFFHLHVRLKIHSQVELPA